jgi:hypothetical protein
VHATRRHESASAIARRPTPKGHASNRLESCGLSGTFNQGTVLEASRSSDAVEVWWSYSC